MKKRIVIFALVVSCFAPCSVQADKGGGESDGSVRSNSEMNKDVGFNAVAAYEKALEVENNLEKELNVLKSIDKKTQELNKYGRDLSQTLLSVGRAMDDRLSAFQRINEKEDVIITARTIVLTAIEDYRQAAIQSLAAATSFAMAGNKLAERKAKMADIALDKKVAAKSKALNIMWAADDVNKSRGHAINDMLYIDDDVKEILKEAHHSVESISSFAGALSERIRKQNIQLTKDVTNALATLRRRLDQIDDSVKSSLSSEYDSYLELCDAAVQLKDENEVRMKALNDYFVASVESVTEMEAHSYIKNALRIYMVNRGNKTLSKQLKEELATISIAEKAAAKEARIAKGSVQAEDIMHKHYRALFANWQADLGRENTVKATLTGEAAALSSELSLFRKMTEELVTTKRKEYFVAVEAADKAYINAFGRERPREMTVAEAPLVERQQSKAMMAHPSIEIENHVYAPVSMLKVEPAGYGSYTYVLFGQRVSKAPEYVKKRYDALLEAIYGTTARYDKMKSSLPKDRLNIFCIPTVKNHINDEAPAVEDYDSDLALSYLATAGSGVIQRKDIIRRIGISPGPFLLTMRRPLDKGSSQNQLLFADLSLYPAEGLSSIVAEYKATIVEDPPQGQFVWSPPAAQRLIYTAMTVSDAAPGIAKYLKQIVAFFVPSTEAGTGTVDGR